MTVSASLPRVLRSLVVNRATPSTKERRSPLLTFALFSLSRMSCEKLMVKLSNPKGIEHPKQNPSAETHLILFQGHQEFQQPGPGDRHGTCVPKDRSTNQVPRRWRCILPSFPSNSLANRFSI